MEFEKFTKDSAQPLKNKYENRSTTIGGNQSALSAEENLKKGILLISIL